MGKMGMGKVFKGLEGSVYDGEWKEVYMMGNGVGVKFMSEKSWISCMRRMD